MSSHLRRSSSRWAAWASCCTSCPDTERSVIGSSFCARVSRGRGFIRASIGPLSLEPRSCLLSPAAVLTATCWELRFAKAFACSHLALATTLQSSFGSFPCMSCWPLQLCQVTGGSPWSSFRYAWLPPPCLTRPIPLLPDTLLPLLAQIRLTRYSSSFTLHSSRFFSCATTIRADLNPTCPWNCPSTPRAVISCPEAFRSLMSMSNKSFAAMIFWTTITSGSCLATTIYFISLKNLTSTFPCLLTPLLYPVRIIILGFSHIQTQATLVTQTDHFGTIGHLFHFVFICNFYSSITHSNANPFALFSLFKKYQSYIQKLIFNFQ